MGKGNQPSGNTTTTQNLQPWSGQQPFLTTGFNKAQDLLNNNPLTYYPGQTVAPVGPQTTQALGLQQQRALSGSPVTNSAQSYATSLMNGSYLNSGNPAFQGMVNQIGQAIAPSIDSRANMDGRSGSGANNYAFDSALSNTAGQLAYQNYGDTLKLMNAQAFNAPTLANQDYTDISQLGNVGQAQQSLQQPYINEDMARFAQNQMSPYQQLQLYGSAIGNPTAGGGTTTSPYFNNPLAQGLGAASALFGGSGFGGQGPSLFSNIGSAGSGLGGKLSKGGGAAADGVGELSGI